MTAAERAPHPHFELLGLCGKGGMGEVYEGLDKRLNRRVALKFLAPDLLSRDDAIKRFHREASAIAALQHNAIAVLYEFGDWAGQPFLAMEYLPGGSLRQRLSADIPFDTLLRHALQIARGLAYAHRKGIVHRDIKPANVLLSEDGDAKIVDFGLARWTSGEKLTRTGTHLGTVGYMAPELVRGAEASPESDQFSWGVSVYELATGAPPFVGDNAAAIVGRILHTTPPPLHSGRHGCPERFSAIVARTMEKNPGQRYPSMDAVAADLEQLQAALSAPTIDIGVPAPSSAPTPNSAPAPRESPRPGRLLAAGCLAAVVISAALIPAIREPIRNRIAGPAHIARRSVIVLPLQNIGSDAANAAFCEGLTETISSLLTQMESPGDNLLVIPSGETRRGRIADVREASRAFNVSYAITGSVERQSGALRVILNLIDARSLRQVASRMRVVELQRAPALPDALAGDLAELLNVSRQPPATVSPAFDLYTQGLGLLEANQPESALPTLLRVVAQDPRSSDGRAALARCYLILYEKRHDASALALADAESDRALAARPGAQAHRVAGLIRQATGRYDDAIAEFGKMIALDPRDAEGYRLRAIAFGRSGRFAEAENEYRAAVRVKPGYWRTYSNLGAFYKSRGQYEKAARALRTVTQLAPENEFGYRNLGGLYHLMGRTDDAVAALLRSIELQPTAEGFSNLGTVFYFQKKYAEAVGYYQKAIQLSAGDSRLHGNLGDALWQLPERREEARRAFGMAAELAAARLQVNPGNPQLRAQLSLYLARLARNDEARQEISSALAAAPHDVDIVFSSARVYELTGDRASALSAVSRALGLGFAPGEVENEPDLAALRNDPAFTRIGQAGPKPPSTKGELHTP